ncbi:MAG: hypothetical protein ACFE8G_04505 [Candidatus Hermodarchaeota archaeon]
MYFKVKIMTIGIFQVDWITVDIIIIELLILFLISAKVLKELYRWRFFYSNSSTVRRFDNLSEINAQFSTIFIKKCTLTKVNFYQQEEIGKPTIIIIRSFRKLMLLKALTEALCFFGYQVLNIRLKTVNRSGKLEMASLIEKELRYAFPIIFRTYNQEVHVLNQVYNVINYNKRLLPLNILFENSDCRNLILINPRLKSYNLEVMLTLLNDSNKYPQLFTIFSEKLNLFLKNTKIKKILLTNEPFKNSKYTIIPKARSTFKYYETVLLSLIMRYIEN